MGIVWFLWGLIVGAPFGILMIAMLSAGRQDDEAHGRLEGDESEE